ncbi:kinase [Lithospermum erythrorhizon]|uniref:Kinase n=1 Tax=Lithospermum erythrorhizon TaxID=34254 RepID=A0AAV3PV13_LITER
MESNRRRGRKSDILRRAWYHLRVSVRDPSRVGTWDAIVVTAASPEQGGLYTWQMERAKRVGRIAKQTATLAVADPDGHRIGSGAGTLNALLALSRTIINEEKGSLVDLIVKKHILLLHAGGDSKRVPWANPMGKLFLPLPYLAADDPDGPVPLLFDHILAIASSARQAFQNQGGLFIMTGDVLPCFDAFTMVLPDDAATIITVPVSLDIASNHGVVVASNSKTSISLVENLLQKPSFDELIKHQALLDDGTTLLDSGIIAVKGKAWVDLVSLACCSQVAISQLVKTKTEASHLSASKTVPFYPSFFP